MQAADIKAAKKLPLKPNVYFDQVDIPFHYQKKGILMMLLRPRMVLGDDVGLGKTLELIVTYSYLRAREPDLRMVVLTERNALFQWQNEIAWLCPDIKTKVITAGVYPEISQRKLLLRRGTDVVITTYSTLYHYLGDLMVGLGPKFMMVADECAYFKNHEAVLFNRMQTLSFAAQRSYGATATVIENRLEEAYSIFRIIAPGTIPSALYFDKQFCIHKKISIGHRRKVDKVTGYKNLDQFRQLIEPVFFSRLQTDPEVEQDLPEEIVKDVPIQMGIEQSKLALDAMAGFMQMPSGEVKQMTILASLTYYQLMVNAPALKGFKAPSEKEETLLESLTHSLKGEKVVVYTRFRTQVDRLEKLLDEAGIGCVRITGKEDEMERERNKQRFQGQAPNEVNVLMMTKAGQRAMNLNRGGHCILFDIPWSYGIYRQVTGRIKRTGSSYKRVGIYRYLAQMHPAVLLPGASLETIDHHTLKVVSRKKVIFNALHGDDTTIEDVTVGELQEIYESIIASRGQPCAQTAP